MNKQTIKPNNVKQAVVCSRTFFQPKLTINQPNDVYEREADTMADQVMRMADPSSGQGEAFFKPAGNILQGKHDFAQPETMNTTAGNYFFKSDKAAGTVIQRVPMPNYSDSLPSKNNTVKQPQPASLSHREIPKGVITREDFNEYVTRYYGIRDIHDGTQQEQEIPFKAKDPKFTALPGWQAWGPGVSSADYSTIIKAIEDVAGAFLAIPVIKNIKFYNTFYETNDVGVVVAVDEVGASFGAGELTIYKSYGKSGGFPVAKSNAQGDYPPVVASVVSTGSKPGAPVPLHNREANLKQTIVHELGHGIAEAAMATDIKTFDNFRASTGWTPGFPTGLFDIGQPEVQKAINDKTAPPSQFKIQLSNWNDPKWIEQPMSGYAVSAPAEDFAESIAAFIYSKNVLKDRSPKRFNFINDGILNWTSQMKTMPPIVPPTVKGDFPVTEEIKHTT